MVLLPFKDSWSSLPKIWKTKTAACFLEFTQYPFKEVLKIFRHFIEYQEKSLAYCTSTTKIDMSFSVISPIVARKRLIHSCRVKLVASDENCLTENGSSYCWKHSNFRWSYEMKCSLFQKTHLFCICSSLNKKYIIKMVDSVFLTTNKLPLDSYEIFFCYTV